jgi:hypothetical protein
MPFRGSWKPGILKESARIGTARTYLAEELPGVLETPEG